MSYPPIGLAKTTNPAKAFTKCPACKSGVWNFEDEVFCDCCPWNSIATHIDAQIETYIHKHKKKLSSEKNGATITEPLFESDVTFKEIVA